MSRLLHLGLGPGSAAFVPVEDGDLELAGWTEEESRVALLLAFQGRRELEDARLFPAEAGPGRIDIELGRHQVGPGGAGGLDELGQGDFRDHGGRIRYEFEWGRRLSPTQDGRQAGAGRPDVASRIQGRLLGLEPGDARARLFEPADVPRAETGGGDLRHLAPEVGFFTGDLGR